MKDQLPVDELYNNRRSFSIIGLTGNAGCGCSRLASIMQNENFFRSENLRSEDGLFTEEVQSLKNTDLFLKKEEHLNDSAVSKLIFKKKYSVCKKFIFENYHPYAVIKYTYVVWLYVFLFLRFKCKKEGISFAKDYLKRKLDEILSNKFDFSHKGSDDDYKTYRGCTDNEVLYQEALDNLDLSKIIDLLSDITCDDFLNARGDDAEKISKLFFDAACDFQNQIKLLNSSLAKRDYLCLCRFYHRLSAVIRATGDPLKDSRRVHQEGSCTHIYDIVKLINVLIKGKNHISDGFDRRIVIDSIRNSLEALYLKERYAGFYLMAVHDNQNRELHLKEKIKSLISEGCEEPDSELVNRMFEKIKLLSDAEAGNKDYEKGRFYSPNVAQCIADAEIHVVNNAPMDEKIPEFYTLEEQWMKYASLILHPGLITPSAEERCMVVAYSAKFNSGCLSRQVGAVITNQYHSIRTIGWNDVPYGQIPCSLRDLNDLTDHSLPEKRNLKYTYSDFERGNITTYDDNTRNFKQKLRCDYANLKTENLKGLPFSYCFKTLENRYSGNKNQVYTRSLHAEENAMLQMVKFGGESLRNGIIYVTASPCELCSKKLYQIGVRKIVYIDPYPGISKEHIIGCGYKRPELKPFQGAYGCAYYKLFQPFMPYKDELDIRTGSTHQLHSSLELLGDFMKKIGKPLKATYTKQEYEEIKEMISEMKMNKDETN